KATTPAPIIKGKIGSSISTVLPETDPANQNSIPSKFCSFKTSNPWVKELKKADIAAPAKTILIGDNPSLPKEPRKNTVTAAIPAIKNAIHIKRISEKTDKKTDEKTTKNNAPAFIPNMLGEAKGFLVNACINAPAIARLDPITVAITAREN